MMNKEDFMSKKYRIIISEGMGGSICFKDLNFFGIICEYLKFYLNLDRKISIQKQ